MLVSEASTLSRIWLGKNSTSISETSAIAAAPKETRGKAHPVTATAQTAIEMIQATSARGTEDTLTPFSKRAVRGGGSHNQLQV